MNSQNRGVLRSSSTGRPHPALRPGLRRRTAAGPAAAAHPDVQISSACKYQKQVQRFHRWYHHLEVILENRVGSGSNLLLWSIAVRKRVATVMMMVKAAAEDTNTYAGRVTRSCCTTITGRSLAGPGPAGPRPGHKRSVHTITGRCRGGASPLNLSNWVLRSSCCVQVLKSPTSTPSGPEHTHPHTHCYTFCHSTTHL